VVAIQKLIFEPSQTYSPRRNLVCAYSESLGTQEPGKLEITVFENSIEKIKVVNTGLPSLLKLPGNLFINVLLQTKIEK
jgi:hypothetical protein